MIHLTTSASSQTIKIIPRSYASTVKMILRDDSTNTSTTYSSISTSTDKNYLVIAQALSPVLVEGRFYDMTIQETTGPKPTIIYKDKIFCSGQLINQENGNYYSVNFNEYTTEDSYDNDYIVI
tara:strand:+ start:84 stop:452 length:369 start_codon:yes stop_codon:yes gene_type:complete